MTDTPEEDQVPEEDLASEESESPPGFGRHNYLPPPPPGKIWRRNVDAARANAGPDGGDEPEIEAVDEGTVHSKGPGPEDDVARAEAEAAAGAAVATVAPAEAEAREVEAEEGDEEEAEAEPEAEEAEEEQPSETWSRAELDSYAASMEPPLDTTGLPNKAAVVEAIQQNAA